MSFCNILTSRMRQAKVPAPTKHCDHSITLAAPFSVD